MIDDKQSISDEKDDRLPYFEIITDKDIKLVDQILVTSTLCLSNWGIVLHVMSSMIGIFNNSLKYNAIE